MIFLETSQSLLPEDLTALQDQFNIKLPPDFKEHYLKFNGGYPEKRHFQWPDQQTTRINAFKSIKYEGFGSFEETYTDLVLLEEYLPAGILPFAVDDGGNFFCISARDEDYNNIYYCNNDDYNPENNEEHLTWLTNNFGDFLDRLV